MIRRAKNTPPSLRTFRWATDCPPCAAPRTCFRCNEREERKEDFAHMCVWRVRRRSRLAGKCWSTRIWRSRAPTIPSSGTSRCRSETKSFLFYLLISDLCFDQGALSWSNLRSTLVGRAVTSVFCYVFETLRVLPRGTYDTQQFLIRGADGLVAGGVSQTFTPMFFFLCRKVGLERRMGAVCLFFSGLLSLCNTASRRSCRRCLGHAVLARPRPLSLCSQEESCQEMSKRRSLFKHLAACFRVAGGRL